MWPNATAVAPSSSFLESECTIAERHGITLDHPVRLFDLAGLGIPAGELRRQVLPSFAQLLWDDYDAKRERVELLRARVPGSDDALDVFLPAYFAGTRDLEDVGEIVAALRPADLAELAAIRPSRRRSVASFTVRRRAAGWEIEREPDRAFAQAGDDADDYRRLQRRFAPTAPAVADAPAYRAVIDRLALLVDEVHSRTLRSLRVTCHQMGLVARPDAAVTNAPEGVHQDGADYIVSALVLERRGIDGGESIVYGPDRRTEYLRHTLLEGQGIFQADRGSPLWHWVTPVRPTAPEGVRNILGYDVQLG